MIIGMDLMTELGMILDLKDKTIEWEDLSIELKPRGLLNKTNMLEYSYEISTAPETIKDAENRQTRILDADYSATDMDEYVQSLEYLNIEQRNTLLNVLKKHPQLFSGGIGTIKKEY